MLSETPEKRPVRTKPIRGKDGRRVPAFYIGMSAIRIFYWGVVSAIQKHC